MQLWPSKEKKRKPVNKLIKCILMNKLICGREKEISGRKKIRGSKLK